VGSIIERKNLLNICRALNYLGNKLDIPLVVIGEGGRYKERVKSYLEVNNMKQKVIFLSEQGSIDKEVRTLAGIYQLSQALVYPSYFEGFGIPVLEALWSKTPVITSHVSCLPETAGDAALYVDPSDYEGIADAMIQIVKNQSLKEDMVRKGREHAKNFSLEICTRNLMNIYQKLI
jgi:glycosyltransferase involved in cell wall biosynthesis